jgi:hypothetical protein
MILLRAQIALNFKEQLDHQKYPRVFMYDATSNLFIAEITTDQQHPRITKNRTIFTLL